MRFFTEIKTISGALILVIIVIVGIGLVTYRSINEVFTAADWRQNSYRVLNHIETILAQVAFSEESQRSYLLTGQERFLAPIQNAKSNIANEFRILNSLIVKGSIQRKKLDTLENVIMYRFENIQQRLILQKEDDIQNEIENLKKGIWQQYMNNIRRITNDMEMTEFESLIQRDKDVVEMIKNASVTILVGTLVTCLIFLSGFYILNNEIGERKKIEKEIRRASEFSERLLKSSIDGIIAFDKNKIIKVWNPGIETMTGIKRIEAVGKSIYKIFPFLKELGENKSIDEVLKGNYSITKDKWFSLPATGKKGYFEAYYSPIHDETNDVVGGLSIIRNTTRRKVALEALQRAKNLLEKRVEERTSELSEANKSLRNEIEERKKAQEKINESLQEKVILLREIHHRVKNNLQVISSLLNLQSGYIQDKKALEIFRESQNRVRSMALIHEKLYQSNDLNRIDFPEYIKSLSRDLFRSYNLDSSKIKFVSDLADIKLEIDIAILCGLIVNELITNCFKHAFPNGKQGEVFVSIQEIKNKSYRLIVKDNGIGFPQNFDYRDTDTLGLQLVNTLTDQLGGKLSLHRNDYTEFKIEFSS
ncbi:MAG: histidine kinase dimerization/phosphoacceptor domain -containing protein [Ignavibacteriaceae bacterium]